GRGRRPSKPEVIGQTRPVDAVLAALPPSAWKRVLIAEGSQGPRLYDSAEVWAYFKEEDGLPGPRAAPGAAFSGTRTRAEISPIERGGGGAAGEGGAGARAALDDRGGHPIGKGRMRVG